MARYGYFYGDFLKKIKKVKYKTNGVSLQHTVLLITQDFLNRKYNKDILKNTCSLVLNSDTNGKKNNSFVNSLIFLT